MFRIRLLSALILIIAASAALLSGGCVLCAALMIISLIGMSEIYKIFGVGKKLPGICGYVFASVYYILLILGDKQAGKEEYIVMLFIAYAICLLSVMVFFYPKYDTGQIFAAFFGFFYVAVMLSYIYRTAALKMGAYTVWLIFICSWGCDTFAYCVGMLFGKHRMAPVLSPKKSVEGGIGGILGAALLAFGYGAAINRFAPVDVNILSYAVIGAAGGAISQAGDLAASAIKRFHDIKDYGRLIPGHGGVLDRFDSVIFTAPVIYYLAILF